LEVNELSAALDEEGSKRYIAMTCHTSSEEAKKAYLGFVEDVEPGMKEQMFKLAKLFVEHPLRGELPSERYAVLDRDWASMVELFREENVPLETEETKLGQQYQELMGGLTVDFQGEEKTLVQMGVYQQGNDRQLRQDAWELVASKRLEVADKCDDFFEQLMGLRIKIAGNAGYENYRDFKHLQKGRFDYEPKDCFKFHEAVEKVVMPAQDELMTDRREKMKLDALRPWDTAVDPLGLEPLKPFTRVEDMVSRTRGIFDHVDTELAEGFQLMRDRKLLDLGNRKGKAPGGYQCSLPEARLPFIFMNAVGLQRDVETLLHEAGHAFHALATQEENLHHYQHAPLEFCEVASMSMELIGNEHLEEFYSEEDAIRARRTHLEGIIGLFPWIATVDAFQHWIYTHPEHTRDERDAFWNELCDRFGGGIDWSGHELSRTKMWHRQLHIFLSPFYYIEYGIAQLGALWVWKNSKADRAKALADYKRALAHGGSRPLPELFQASGAPFSFDAEAFKPLIELVQTELSALE
ncbi:MAG: M3 family oligoendopeptidase, partial [Verrucomicrobiota bacterium]|nr:M3 family oligoendopeptidase [Verrucomicrobiota bacterium]